jgi:hypothetical protein
MFMLPFLFSVLLAMTGGAMGSKASVARNIENEQKLK